MAKPKRKKRKPGGGYTPPPVDNDALITEAEAIIAQLDDATGGALWGQAQKLLLKAHGDATLIARAIAARDAPLLGEIIHAMRNPESGEAEALEASTTAKETAYAELLAAVSNDDMRNAMKVFRRRLKLIKLDHESKLGRSPLTSGKDAGFEAIIAPPEIPGEVWQALANRGDLEDIGQGFYKLATQRKSF